MVDLALKMLLDHKGRFLATVLGVGFAVALVLIQVGLFFGLLENASITIEKLDADLWVMARNTANVDFGNPFPETYVQRVRSIPGVARPWLPCRPGPRNRSSITHWKTSAAGHFPGMSSREVRPT